MVCRFCQKEATMITDIFSVKGKSVLITGAASGLGREMAQACVENGARVALIDNDYESLAKTAAELGPSVLHYMADVANKLQMENAVREVHLALGSLDVVIANAGVTDATPALLHETTDDVWNRVMDINVSGLLFTARPALAIMVKQGYGKLITVASMFGIAAPAGLFPRPAVAASKGAIINLTRELAIQYAPYNIQVNALCPGFFRTPTRPRSEANAKIMVDYTPMKRIADASEIKGSVLYLASSASNFVTGTTLVIDGGVLAR
jgi:NAD(P)-dependent dehydrogenase (short-subunit alcohol dehydrogenase family)